MPKGGHKPAAAAVLAIDEVATTLRVQPSQVQDWIQKDKLRGNEHGVRPYDLKKFQVDHDEEIRRAQAKALKDSQRPIEKQKPSKNVGFFARLFGSGKPRPEEAVGGDLAAENARLREELQKARQAPRDEAATTQLEDKVKYLEGKLSKVSSLEAQVVDLKRRLAENDAPSAGPALTPELQQRLERAEALARESESLRQALEVAQQEKVALRSELESQLQHAPAASETFPDPEQEAQVTELQRALQENQEQLQLWQSTNQEEISQLTQRLEQKEQELEALRSQLESSRVAVTPPPATEASPLVEELLGLQEANLARFARLRELYHQAQNQLAQMPQSSDTEAAYSRLQSEFETLRVKHQTLVEARESNASEQNEYAEQLAAARATTSRLKQENAALKARLVEADVDRWKQKAEELQQQLSAGRASDHSLDQLEDELRAAKKSLQGREAQVQKIAVRLQENERALKKALKESTRLTELLIERENRLRDVSTEYEQEYREKIDTLDRQVSGLQWKLSLREERIASLESEVSELRKAGRGERNLP